MRLAGRETKREGEREVCLLMHYNDMGLSSIILGIVMDFKEVIDIASKCSIIVAVAAYLLQRRSMRLQHERARREKATQAILDYARSLTPQSAAARKLARHLDNNQIDELDQGHEFDITTTHRDLVLAALPNHVTPAELPKTGNMRLTRSQSFQLRWEIISRLNACEVVAQCWLTDVADKKTIENELRFLLDDVLATNITTTFRKIMPQEHYPALSALIAELERQRTPNSTPKKMDQSFWQRITSVFQ